MCMRVLMAVLVVLLLASAGAAQGPPAVAVADFIDDSVYGSRIGAARLSADLAQVLAQAAGPRLRVVPIAEVRAAIRARGYRPEDLVSPTRTQEIAAAVGAQWVVTGRWHDLDADFDVITLPNDIRLVTGRAWAVLEIRVLDAATRRVLLDDSYSGSSAGVTGTFILQAAAREAIRRAAAGIAGL